MMDGYFPLVPASMLRTGFVGAVMGIYDREYYRDETGGSGWFSGASPAVRTIILVNVAAWAAQWFISGQGFESLLHANSREILSQFRLWELVTAPFLHGPHDILRLVFSMLLLWSFGREMESMYGSREFTFMYLTAAVFSTLCWAIVDAASGHSGSMMRASGPVFATLTLYTLYNPRREILFMYVLPLEMWLAMLVLIGLDMFFLVGEMRGMEGGVPAAAFVPQIAGAGFGYLYKTYDLRWSRLLNGRMRRPRLRVVSPEPRDRVSSLPTAGSRSASAGTSRPNSPLAYPEEQLDARLDEILAKIARDGRGVLTEEENRILEEASRRYRDRRSDRL